MGVISNFLDRVTVKGRKYGWEDVNLDHQARPDAGPVQRHPSTCRCCGQPMPGPRAVAAELYAFEDATHPTMRIADHAALFTV
jgi:phospholipase/lecithinase/hemolysin